MGQPLMDQRQRQEAFAAHVLPEIDVLLRVARSLTRHPADAEDLVQDTLLRAFRGIDRFDGRHPRAWLLTIMRNAHANRTRQKRPDLFIEGDDAVERVAAPVAEGPEAVIVGERFDSAVEAAFVALPERFRRVVELVDLDGLSYLETSAVIGVPVGTVMSRLHRARKRMRDRLRAAGIDAKGGRS